MSKEHEKQLVALSVWAELIGYIGSISMSIMKLREIEASERATAARIDRARKEEGGCDIDAGAARAGLEKQLAAIRAIKALRLAVIVQDLADTVIAINDVRGTNQPLVLALAGLVSGGISAYKNWA